MSATPGFDVGPGALGASGRALLDDAEALRRGGLAASDASGAASHASGEGPLAASLARFGEQLDLAVRAVADGVARSAQGLEASATTYRTQDSTAGSVLGDVLLPRPGPGR